MSKTRVIVLALSLIALALRVYGITYHSLWFDEVISTYWAAKPAAEIWRVGLALVQDKHPPLYYWLLHVWMALFGSGDFAIRGLGALLGALAVFPAYGIGRILSGRRGAFFGALLVAVNPFLIWYSQEARMFMPATTFSLVGLYGLLRLNACGPHEERRSTAIWYATLSVGGFTAALYTYLFSALLLPVAAAWVLALAWTGRGKPRTRRHLLLSLAALAAIGILFLPLARAAWSVSGSESEPGRAFAGLLPALPALLQLYTAGWQRWPVPLPAILTAGAALLLLWGVIAPTAHTHPTDSSATRPGNGSPDDRRPSQVPARLLLGTWLLLPILIGGVLLARDRTVFGEPRYFIFLVPALCLTWGRGLEALWARAGGFEAGRKRSPGANADSTTRSKASRARARAYVLSIAATGLLLGMTLAALPWLWAPESRREGWRETAAFLASHAGLNDAVLVEPDYVAPALARYFAGPQPTFVPFTGELTAQAEIDPALKGLAGYDAVWLVQSHQEQLDPQNLVAAWFGARYPMISEVFPPGIAVRGFAQHYRSPLPAAQETASPAQTAFGELRLLNCAYDPHILPAADRMLHPPSNWIHITTRWTADSPPAGDYVPIIRLVDGMGQVWGESLGRPNDAFHVWPTSRWLPGEVVRADTDVNLNPATPRGTYHLIASLPGRPGTARCGDVTITD